MKSKELCVYLERLRSARNISQEAFTDEIVSLRQYRRYLSGESDIPFQIIHQLTVKLGIKTDSLLRDFDYAKVLESELIIKMYNNVVNYDFEEYLKSYKNVPLEHIIENNNRLLYQYTHILYLYFIKKLSLDDAAQAIVKLVNYPKILNQQVVTSVELLIISSFLDFLDESHHKNILEKIEMYIKDQSILISDANEKIYIFVLAKLAKHLGINEDLKGVITYCSIGIKRNIELKSFYLMDYFYYYSALAYHSLGQMDKYEKYLVKCFNVLQFEGNDSKIKKFRDLIIEDFNVEFDEYVLNHYLQKRENKKN